ncbi:hypothetical protein BASA83_007348 [Batrachochytrium salamandrivorans]|nr:hypothetical protein BASA83_007348 [Batrachochytrium salamandrivorans]
MPSVPLTKQTADTTDQRKTVKQRHSFALMETLRTVETLHRSKVVTRQFLVTSGFFKDPSFDQSRAHGTRYMMLAPWMHSGQQEKPFGLAYYSTLTHSIDRCIYAPAVTQHIHCSSRG